MVKESFFPAQNRPLKHDFIEIENEIFVFKLKNKRLRGDENSESENAQSSFVLIYKHSAKGTLSNLTTFPTKLFIVFHILTIIQIQMVHEESFLINKNNQYIKPILYNDYLKIKLVFPVLPVFKRKPEILKVPLKLTSKVL